MMDNRLSHAYLLVAPQADERTKQASALAQRLLCSQAQPPCGRCRDCRKALAGSHPDLVWLHRQTDDKGKPRREITVDQIRSLTADAAIAPNEAERKVYIIPEADCMNPQAQNALLKALEDPPGHACFILCTAAADALLPTVLSRLVRIHRPQTQAEEDDALAPFAAEYLSLLAEGDRSALALFCMQRAKLTGDEALAFVDSVKTQVWQALRGERPLDLSRDKLFRISGWMDTAELYLRRNLGARQIFGMLMTADLESGKENRNWQL